MSTSLYGLLGVDPGADTAAIRKAYRRVVKTAHPDAGGDPEAFRAIQCAHDVLTDPDRRARYDATGKADEAKPDTTAAEVGAILNGLMSQIFGGDRDLGTLDLIAEMTRALDKNIHEMRSRLPAVRKQAERTRAAREHIHRKKADGENMLRSMIDWQLAQLELAEGQVTRAIELHEAAKTTLADYRFDHSKVQPTYQRYTPTSSTTWSTF